jgi:hypothetical protein
MTIEINDGVFNLSRENCSNSLISDSICKLCVRDSQKLVMFTTRSIALLSLAGSVVSHGHHDDQSPLLGPHKSLWYNTLPGDGGTQVHFLNLFIQSSSGLTVLVGRFCVFRHLHLWSNRLSSMSLQRRRQVRYCFHWSPVRHWYLIQTRSSIRTFWNQTRFSTTQSLVRVFFLSHSNVNVCSRRAGFSGKKIS